MNLCYRFCLFFVTVMILCVTYQYLSGNDALQNVVPTTSAVKPLSLSSTLNTDKKRILMVARRRLHIKDFSNQHDNSSSTVNIMPLFHKYPIWDPTELGDVETVIPLCKKSLLVVILVTSAPGNVERRQSIRRSWASYTVKDDSLKVVFLIGRTKDAMLSDALESEQMHYHDILIGNYLDTYRNLTLKVLHGFQWITSQCETKFVLKTDDDCFLNMPVLYNLLLVAQESSTKALYVGKSPASLSVIRNPYNKWHVTKAEYALDRYPVYMSGTGYLLSADLVSSITGISSYIQPFPNEDAFVGVVNTFLGVKPINSARFTSYSKSWSSCNYRYIVLMHNLPAELQSQCYQMALQAPLQCQNVHVITDWH